MTKFSDRLIAVVGLGVDGGSCVSMLLNPCPSITLGLTLLRFRMEMHVHWQEEPHKSQVRFSPEGYLAVLC